MRRSLFALFLAGCLFCASGCIKPKISIFPEHTEPLKEYTLQGKGDKKILVIPVKGFISEDTRGLPLMRRSGAVQEVVAQLRKAEKDKDIKALILEVDSPGGSVTASDMLYHEITRYRECSGAKLVVMMMSVAASGGYYISLPADFIMAHPTTITGSVGVLFLRPNVTGLMGKIGLEIEVDKSGQNKDMASPFRKPSAEERQMLKSIIDEMAGRFQGLAANRRHLSDAARKEIASGRIFLADDALRLGLIDRIGYVEDAISEAEKLAGLPKDAKVVVYRRTEYNNDNIYNTATARQETPQISLLDSGLAEAIPPMLSGFYYLWLPGGCE